MMPLILNHVGVSRLICKDIAMVGFQTSLPLVGNHPRLTRLMIDAHHITESKNRVLCKLWC